LSDVFTYKSIIRESSRTALLVFFEVTYIYPLSSK
jgi:hypothetical protein